MNSTGGPAFPHVADLVQHSPNGGITTKPITSNGMTLRDYFAAQAIIAYHADGEFSDSEDVASWCYRLADAMLEARKP
jgi:hypothetical protein